MEVTGDPKTDEDARTTTTANVFKSSSDGTGTGSVIRINVEGRGVAAVGTENRFMGREPIPFNIALGHELGHASDNWNGSNNRFVSAVYDFDNRRPTTMTFGEISARHRENGLRREQGFAPTNLRVIPSTRGVPNRFREKANTYNRLVSDTFNIPFTD